MRGWARVRRDGSLVGAGAVLGLLGAVGRAAGFVVRMGWDSKGRNNRVDKTSKDSVGQT